LTAFAREGYASNPDLGSRDYPATGSAGPRERTPRRPPLSSQRPAFHGSGAVAFSTKGEYGVRLLAQLARHHGAGPASLAEIAAAEDLPRAYLEQLAFVLRDAGLVASTRGAHGGYELTRDPADIRMGEVLRALEGPLAPMICASDDPAHIECGRTASCTVNVLWLRVRDAIATTLDGMTLADLVPVRGAPIGLDPRPGRPALEGALSHS
jgi:Rrf2 family cysteine metabolism transcriptional repressor